MRLFYQVEKFEILTTEHDVPLSVLRETFKNKKMGPRSGRTLLQKRFVGTAQFF